jgi:hypothetical protein
VLSRSRIDVLVGGAVVLVFALVQGALLRGPRPWDPARYWDSAVHFAHPEPDLFNLRIGVILPVRVAVVLYGPSEAALYTVPLLAGMVLTAAVFGTMLLLFDDRVVAAGAALATSLSAYYLIYSSFIFPDPLATAAFTAGIFFLVLGSRRESSRRRIVSVVAAGALFAWAYLVREFSPLVLLPALVAALVVLRYKLRDALVLAAAALATWVAEPLYGLVRYDEPFLHLRFLTGRGGEPISQGRLARVEHIQGQLDNVFDTLVVFPRLLVTWHVGWVFLGLLVLFGVALAVTRDRRLALLAAWLLSFWAVMAVLGLFTLSSGRWLLNITNIRYWSPALPPLVMGAFGGLALLASGRPRVRRIPILSAAVAVVTLSAVVPGVAQYRSCTRFWPADPLGRWHELRSWLGTSEAQHYRVLLTDPQSRRYISAYSHSLFGKSLWDGQVNGVGRAGELVPTTAPADTLVLVDRDEFRFRDALQRIRVGWAPVFSSSDGMMVALAARGPARADAVTSEQWWQLPRDPLGSPRAQTCAMQPYYLRVK